ncbi:neuropeptide FF receptor 2 [Hemicordylus capensis]|uniref:neuropeptide FF receptor 2 n=1 Tax=Hemicordylus capensis TaxID=884348 RepID=UPI002303D894|nr:neuropeptide FF receptor 2 [Hemicordylus capensis]XP_053113021.1 neuropeptide FF receptor 2 [Hemicordylus capensis]XP_053113022.1 neuropeptide FF receptor 2 [Hemicordylus capensis]XP_053113023.1 neuropeptide FF receptor 2 [Hemicordylus capensis]XP_053113024.1 neuropeptide FF receptor 2 [Hemicordylus capensis]XP_053113025.1 neuropeptide FF receptor 2 [Hemicordylus capensis]XP_053113026.1 neuropeptide FF receptor 2 [Hemicordylus capensis]
MDKNVEPGSSVSGPPVRNCSGYTSSCLMESNISYVGFYLHQPLVATVFIISYLLIFLLCMIGNGVVCFIVLRSKHMRTVTNLFILNLAVSDLLVGIFCMPTTLLDNIISGWPFGNMVCKMNGMVQGISVSASVFTLVAIAVDRFRSIVYPFKQKLTLWTAVVIIAVVWILAIAIMCPSAVMLKVEEEKRFRVILGIGNQSSPIYWCREDWPNQDMRKIYTTVLFANIYLAPLSLIVIMYARIGITLFSTAVPATGKQGQERHSVYRKKLKVIKMLIIVALLFILSWLPLWTLAMLSDYANLNEGQLQIINIYIYPFAHWLAFFNSSINPIIYGFFNENFRRGFQAAFRLQLCSGDMIPREIYSQRGQSNAILPVAGHQEGTCNLMTTGTGRLTQQGNWMDKTQVLMMENLDQASTNNGIKQDLL